MRTGTFEERQSVQSLGRINLFDRGCFEIGRKIWELEQTDHLKFGNGGAGDYVTDNYFRLGSGTYDTR